MAVEAAIICLQASSAHFEVLALGTQGPPKGPSISNIRGGSILVTSFLVLGGSTNLRWTSGGTDTEAEPIREAHREVLERSLDGYMVDSAGTKKSGSNAVRLEKLVRKRFEEALAAMVAHSTQRRCAFTEKYCGRRKPRDLAYSAVGHDCFRSFSFLLPCHVPSFFQGTTRSSCTCTCTILSTTTLVVCRSMIDSVSP